MRAIYQGPVGGIPFNPAIHGHIPEMNPADRRLFNAVVFANETDFLPLMNAAIADGASIDATDSAGNNLLQAGVQRNSVRIVQALLALDAPLPVVPPSGVDLVMQAAAQDNAAMVSLLVDSADMLVDASDATGKTALHYAVKSGSLSTIEALLQRGANCDAPACGMSAAEIADIFGTRSSLSGADVTPLAIAVGRCDVPAAMRLLEAGAMLTPRWRNPLWIAASNSDAAMFDMLLNHCATTRQTSTVLNQAVLECTLIGNEQTHLLRQVLEHHESHPSDALDLDTALLVAVTVGHVDQAALLLEKGAYINADAETIESIWTAAADQEDEALLDLLTASSDIAFDGMLMTRLDGPPVLLTQLCALVDDPQILAANGIFVSIVRPIIPPLRHLNVTAGTLTTAQLANETALLLSHWLPQDQPDPLQAAPGSPLAQAEHISNFNFIAELQYNQPTIRHGQSQFIDNAVAARRRSMSALATQTLQSLQAGLINSLSANFLLKAREHADAGNQHLELSMQQTLCDEHGLPDQLAQLIARAWSASEIVIGSEMSTSAAPDAEVVSRLMFHTLFCKLDDTTASEHSLMYYCKNILTDQLSTAHAQLMPLVGQPARFLRALEHRQGLQPVNVASLTLSIQTATGLPAAVCAALASCWQRAVSDARQSVDGRNFDTGNRFEQLDQAFSSHWQNWLEENAGQTGEAALPLTPEEVLQAIGWCEGIRQRGEETRKRKAGAEAEGAPPAKPPRLQ